MSDKPDLAHALDRAAQRLIAVAERCPGEHWTVAPDADTWSPAQIFEHVLKVERAVGGALAAVPEADDAPDAISTATADAIRAALLDRTNHPPAPSHMRPSDVPASFVELRPQYAAANAALGELERTVGEGLRRRHVKHGRFGLLNGKQWLVLLAAHAERHAEQLDEVMRRLSAAGS